MSSSERLNIDFLLDRDSSVVKHGNSAEPHSPQPEIQQFQMDIDAEMNQDAYSR